MERYELKEETGWKKPIQCYHIVDDAETGKESRTSMFPQWDTFEEAEECLKSHMVPMFRLEGIGSIDDDSELECEVYEGCFKC